MKQIIVITLLTLLLNTTSFAQLNWEHSKKRAKNFYREASSLNSKIKAKIR